MKIFYAFAGQGFGHISRASVIVKLLEKLGHQVRLATYDQSLTFAREIGWHDVVEIEGFRTQHHPNKGTSALKTVLKFFNCAPKFIFANSAKLKKALKGFTPDLVISDMEPFSSYWSRWREIPLMIISNQGMFLLSRVPVPKKFFNDYLSAKAVVSLMEPPGKMNFILTFSPNLTPIKKHDLKRAVLVPPILRPEVFELRPQKNDFVLVYQTLPLYQQRLNNLVGLFPKIKFYIYNSGLNTSPSPNVIIRQFSPTKLLEDLANCRAVMINGGFTVMSEAIYLGKPVFSMPIHGDFEQTLNAILLERSGYGKFADDFSQANLEDFLAKLPVFEKNLQGYQQDKNHLFESKLKEVLG